MLSDLSSRLDVEQDKDRALLLDALRSCAEAKLLSGPQIVSGCVWLGSEPRFALRCPLFGAI